MKGKRVLSSGAIVGLGLGLAVWWHSQRGEEEVGMALTPPQARALLERAAPLLRLPSAPERVPEVLPDGSGLRCPTTGRIYPYRDGVLTLLAEQVELTETQKLLDTPFTAWIYDRFREAMLLPLGLPDFATEVAQIGQQLALRAGDAVLDLACGHGNFTVAWAEQVGPEGLVIGLDLSPAMLARAAQRVQQAGATNILLVRGDAHHLPLADASVDKVNCSGGFHQLPDLPQALREIARVSVSGAPLTASTFAEGPSDRWLAFKHWLHERMEFHFVPLEWLGQELARVGYGGYRWSLPGGWFGYASARKGATEQAK